MRGTYWQGNSYRHDTRAQCRCPSIDSSFTSFSSFFAFSISRVIFLSQGRASAVIPFVPQLPGDSNQRENRTFSFLWKSCLVVVWLAKWNEVDQSKCRCFSLASTLYNTYVQAALVAICNFIFCVIGSMFTFSWDQWSQGNIHTHCWSTFWATLYFSSLAAFLS